MGSDLSVVYPSIYNLSFLTRNHRNIKITLSCSSRIPLDVFIFVLLNYYVFFPELFNTQYKFRI